MRATISKNFLRSDKMKNNLTQVKSDGLPVVSEDQQVQKNSMRLYIYLISISKFQGKNKPRTFT